MDAIKSILVKEIEQINRREGRDGKPRFNSEFARTHRYLCLAMFAGYFAVIAVMYRALHGDICLPRASPLSCCSCSPCC